MVTAVWRFPRLASTFMPRKALIAVVTVAMWTATSHAQWREWDAEYDEEKKSWQEIQAQIPPYPKPENLVQLKAGNVTSHRFYIDASSLSVGEDGVTRYTAVVKTTGGATNIAFEGMRCETRERKVYALGHNDGTWARARYSKWQRIELRELTPYYYVLYREYFCPSRARPTNPKRAVEALKWGVGLGSTIAD